jgi:hypothetical protein
VREEALSGSIAVHSPDVCSDASWCSGGALQVLESPLEKKAGVNFGPPGTKQLIYFVDDLNMPKLDPYETAMPISLIRQHLGWGHW